MKYFRHVARLVALYYRRVSLDVRMGRCSGFRWCCILWFITIWRLMTTHTRTRYSKRVGFGRGYVACPLCACRRSFVQPLRCTSECGHLLEGHVWCRDMALEHGYIGLAREWQALINDGV